MCNFSVKKQKNADLAVRGYFAHFNSTPQILWNLKRVLFLFICFAVTFFSFADGNVSLIDPSAVEVNNFTSRDITAQIALREAYIEINFLRIREINHQKIAFIERANLSWWDQRRNVQIKEYNRQIKVYEDQNKRYENEIRQFRRKL